MNMPLRDDDALFASLLERWASGAFTRADEAALQRLIGDDAFRREAWEGFTALPAEAHAEALGRLKQRLTPAPRRRRPGLMRYWLAAAAVFLLAGALYWWWADAPDSPEQATAPALEWSADDSNAIAAHAAPEGVPDENAQRRAYTAAEAAPHTQTMPQVPAPHSQIHAAAPQRETSESDTSAVLAYRDNLSLEAPPPETSRAIEQAAKRSPTPSETLRSPQISRRMEPAAAPPSDAAKNVQPLSAPTQAAPSKRPSAVGGPPAGRPKSDAEPFQPQGGWAALLQQYRQTKPLGRTIEADTLLLQVLVRPDSTLLLLGVEPALSPEETRRLERFLRQYRWTPVTKTVSTLRLPAEH